jgi:hypothetical protein
MIDPSQIRHLGHAGIIIKLGSWDLRRIIIYSMAACLPLDVLENIAGCSASAEDLTRMGSVCKEWRVASRNVAALNITRKDGVAPEVEEILPSFIRQLTRLRTLQIEMADCGRPLHVMAAIVSAGAALGDLRLTRRGKNMFYYDVPDFLHPSDVISNMFRLSNLQHLQLHTFQPFEVATQSAPRWRLTSGLSALGSLKVEDVHVEGRILNEVLQHCPMLANFEIGSLRVRHGWDTPICSASLHTLRIWRLQPFKPRAYKLDMPTLTSLQVQHDINEDRSFGIHLVQHQLTHLTAYTRLKVGANKPGSLLQLKELNISAASRREIAGLKVGWKATVDTKVHAFPFLKKLVIQWPLELEDLIQPPRSPSGFGEVPVSMFCKQLRSLEELVLDVPFLEVLTVTDTCLESTPLLQHLCSLTSKIVFSKAYV